MAYVLLASLLGALGWGLKSATSIPHPDGLTLIVSSIVVLMGSLFWVLVTLHALDLIVALRRSDRAYLADAASSLRPRMRELLIAVPLTVLSLLAAYESVGAAGAVFLFIAAPFYALSIAAAMSASPRQGKKLPRWRTGLTLSVICTALFSVTTALFSTTAVRATPDGTALWLGTTSAMAAVALYFSAAQFRSSVEQGRVLASPVLDDWEARFRANRTSPRPRATPGRRQKAPPRPFPQRLPPQHGRRRARRRH